MERETDAVESFDFRVHSLLEIPEPLLGEHLFLAGVIQLWLPSPTSLIQVLNVAHRTFFFSITLPSP